MTVICEAGFKNNHLFPILGQDRPGCNNGSQRLKLQAVLRTNGAATSRNLGN